MGRIGTSNFAVDRQERIIDSSPVPIIPSPPVVGFEHLCPWELLAVRRFVDPQFAGKKVFQQP
jgi:hypothetical protein